jgi:hypothetical protein
MQGPSHLQIAKMGNIPFATAVPISVYFAEIHVWLALQSVFQSRFRKCK